MESSSVIRHLFFRRTVVPIALVAVRAVKKGTLGDRAVAMDMLTAVVSCTLLVAAAYTAWTGLRARQATSA